jgi:hypothetical protein
VASTGLKTNYDVALVDDTGVVLARRRISDDALGYQLLLGVLADHGDSQADPIPAAIETPLGLLVACLRRTGRQIYAINPLAVPAFSLRAGHPAHGLLSPGTYLLAEDVAVGRPWKLIDDQLWRRAYMHLAPRSMDSAERRRLVGIWAIEQRIQAWFGRTARA